MEILQELHVCTHQHILYHLWPIELAAGCWRFQLLLLLKKIGKLDNILETALINHYNVAMLILRTV